MVAARCFAEKLKEEGAALSGYSAFARYYDELTANINYKQRGMYFHDIIQRFKTTRENILLDLACGTGSISEVMAGLGYVGKSLFGRTMGIDYVGDYNFVNEEKKPGTFHSHGLAYVRNGDKLDFYGSVNDRTGYTVIYADMNNNTLKFSKDIGEYPLQAPRDTCKQYFYLRDGTRLLRMGEYSRH